MHVSVFLEEPNLPLEQFLPVREPSKTCNERKNKLRQVSQIMWLLVNKLFVFHIFREINLKCKTKALSVGWDNTQNLLVSYLLHATWRYVLFFLKKGFDLAKLLSLLSAHSPPSLRRWLNLRSALNPRCRIGRMRTWALTDLFRFVPLFPEITITKWWKFYLFRSKLTFDVY